MGIEGALEKRGETEGALLQWGSKGALLEGGNISEKWEQRGHYYREGAQRGHYYRKKGMGGIITKWGHRRDTFIEKGAQRGHYS